MSISPDRDEAPLNSYLLYLRHLPRKFKGSGSYHISIMGIIDGNCRSGDERISSISSITNCDKYKGNDEEKFEFFAEVIGLHGKFKR